MIGGKQVEAKRVVGPTSSLATKVEVHKLNGRNQSSLTREALEDILPSIESSGILFESVAVEQNDKYLLLDSSRRFAVAKIVQCELPLWVIEENISRRNAQYISDLSRLSKALSWREEGMIYVDAMENNPEITDIDNLLEHYNFDLKEKRSVQRRIDAARIHQNLIDLFPDPDGIPNKFYEKLKGIEKKLNKKYTHGIDKVITDFKSNLSLDPKKTIREKQDDVLDSLLNYFSPKSTSDSVWVEEVHLFTKNKDTFVRKKSHKNGKRVVFECSRLTRSQIEKIESLVASFDL